MRTIHDLMSCTRIVTYQIFVFVLQIRIHIKQTESRQITVCIRFPSNYPSSHLLVELKSVTISGKLLTGLTTLAEQKANECIGKPQV